MVSPNVNFNLPTSALVLVASIALAYFSHIGWWAFAGLLYFLYARLDNDILELICLSASVILAFVAILKMGWAF